MTNKEAISVLRITRPIPHRGDGKSTTHALEMIALDMAIKALEQEPKTGYCKDCKYFERDSAVKVDGAPLIVAHEICSKWGNGCKTREDGFCFLFEPQERTCKNCTNAKECVMYEPNMKRCNEYKESEVQDANCD